jgi:hypothetical protein
MPGTGECFNAAVRGGVAFGLGHGFKDASFRRAAKSCRPPATGGTQGETPRKKGVRWGEKDRLSSGFATDSVVP